MGLLDALNYDMPPSSGGGLLDFLRNLQLQPQSNALAGLPSDQAQYGSAPASQPGVLPQPIAQPPSQAMAQMPAASPPAVLQAQPAMQPMPQMQQPSYGSASGIGDRLSLAGKGFVGNLHNGVLGALLGGVMPLVTGDPTDAGTIGRNLGNANAAALMSKGVPENIARTAVLPGNEKLLDTLEHSTFASDKTNDAKNFEYGLLHPDFAKAQATERAKFGLTPLYASGEDGVPHAVQLNDQGGVQEVKLPKGLTLSKGPIRTDVGTGVVLTDPITRQQVGYIPKDIAGAAREKVEGTAQGNAAVALPQVQAASQQVLKTIDDLQNHPGKGWSLGMYSNVPTIPGTEQANFRTALDQLKGQTFLQAFSTLRGGGAISDVEGAKATAAIARLNTAQTTDAFDKALSDFRGVVQGGMLRAAAKARGSSSGTTTQPAAADPLGLR